MQLFDALKGFVTAMNTNFRNQMKLNSFWMLCSHETRTFKGAGY